MEDAIRLFVQLKTIETIVGLVCAIPMTIILVIWIFGTFWNDIIRPMLKDLGIWMKNSIKEIRQWWSK